MMHKKKADAEMGCSSGLKRLKYRSEEEDNANLAVVPYRACTKIAAIVACVSEPDDSSELRRVSPKWLVDAMQHLNARQRSSVDELGFGQLFHLQVDSVPGKLVSWFLDSFQPMSCSLELHNKPAIHVAAEDVYLIFGLPKGPSRIDRNGRTKDKEIVEEWATRFGKSKFKILPSDIVSAMLAEVDGGDWFKRLYLMLVESCLFENAADGYVKPKIMDIIRDLSKIREYDWCDHIITSLLRSHDKWVENKSNKFIGPSLFIVLFYVDRFVHYKRNVARVFPLVRGWTSDVIRVRYRDEVAKVGFGRGHVAGRFDPSENVRPLLEPAVHEMAVPTLVQGVERSIGKSVNPDDYILDLLTSAKKVADSMSEFMALIVDAPLDIRADPTFVGVVQSTGALIGIKATSVDTSAAGAPSCSQKLFSDDWAKPEWQCTLTRMMEVWEARQQLECSLGDPSFSLGLTQDPNFIRVVQSPAEMEAEILSEHGAFASVPAAITLVSSGPSVGKERLFESVFSELEVQLPAQVIGLSVGDFESTPEDNTVQTCAAIASVLKDLSVDQILDAMEIPNLDEVEKVEQGLVARGGGGMVLAVDNVAIVQDFENVCILLINFFVC